MKKYVLTILFPCLLKVSLLVFFSMLSIRSALHYIFALMIVCLILAVQLLSCDIFQLHRSRVIPVTFISDLLLFGFIRLLF